MDAIQAERFPDRADLLDIELGRPHRGIVRIRHRGVPATELVVEDHAPPLGERLVRLHVMPGRARPTVQAEERELAGSSPSPTTRYHVS